jgi:hypothetical protein
VIQQWSDVGPAERNAFGQPSPDVSGLGQWANSYVAGMGVIPDGITRWISKFRRNPVGGRRLPPHRRRARRRMRANPNYLRQVNGYGTSDLAEELFSPIRAMSLAVFCLSIRPGLFDIDEHHKDLSAKGNDLERRNAIVDFEMFLQQDRDARWTVRREWRKTHLISRSPSWLQEPYRHRPRLWPDPHMEGDRRRLP